MNRIVVIEDDPAILRGLADNLRMEPYEVLTAADGSDGFRVVCEANPDLVILDIMLPQKSGFLVLERIRQGKPRGSKPRVIMITGNQGKRHKQYAESLGVDAYLNKPFRMDALLEATEKLLTKP